jgi:hypothetical protein
MLLDMVDTQGKRAASLCPLIWSAEVQVCLLQSAGWTECCGGDCWRVESYQPDECACFEEAML